MEDAQFIPGREMASAGAVAARNKVLRNTYLLLSLTLLFSAAMTSLAIAMEVQYLGWIPLLIAFGLLFVISRMRNSVWGLLLVFAFTGILGFSLGPIVNYYLQTSAGSQVVITAAGLTGMIFFSLSAYALLSKKDFSFMSGFLMTGLWVVLGTLLLSLLGGLFGFYISGLHLAISAAIVILMSGFILYDTSRILHGGETNYIMATVSMYLNIYNIFVSLLHILGVTSDD